MLPLRVGLDMLNWPLLAGLRAGWRDKRPFLRMRQRQTHACGLMISGSTPGWEYWLVEVRPWKPGRRNP
jgi:hypothetical protein